MKCMCVQESGGKLAFCELHAREHKRRLAVVVEDLATAAVRLDATRLTTLPGATKEVNEARARESVSEWQKALLRAREACRG
jgi:hypothetical protein